MSRKHASDQEAHPGDAQPAAEDKTTLEEGASPEPAGEARNAEEAEDDPEDRESADTVEALRARLQRTVADFQNFRKQAEKRQADVRRFAAKEFFHDLLPIVDNFTAAMKAVEGGQDPKSVLVGVQMIHEMLLKYLADNQVEAIDAEGRTFDPELHEAVSRQETAEHEPNTIVREIQRGYRMGPLVIRHARVIVAAPPSEDAATSDERNED